jgi:hypothetical protein
MKAIIIVSKCIKVRKRGTTETWFQFHFRGVFGGEAIKKVELKGRNDFKIQVGEEYLMYVQMISCEKGIVTGNILKVKPLEECWDKS